MTARRIVPCLDVKDGRVVKGVRFEGHVDMGDAAELAARYRDQGADELVFYDITASPEGRTLDYGWVQDIARLLDIPFCVAGGIRTVEQAARCLDHGADKVSINSPALERPDLIGEMAQRLLASMLAKPEPQVGLLGLLGNGPTNPKAAALVPAELRRFNPTDPENEKQQLVINGSWWGENYQAVNQDYIDAVTG